MNELSDAARKVFNALPSDGETIGGISLTKRLGISQSDFRLAKVELKDRRLVVLGRGRGGSLGRAEGAELPPEEHKPDVKERLAVAREIKKEKSRSQRELESVKEQVVTWGWEHYPEAEKIEPGLYNGRWYITVWNNKIGRDHFLPDYVGIAHE